MKRLLLLLIKSLGYVLAKRSRLENERVTYATELEHARERVRGLERLQKAYENLEAELKSRDHVLEKAVAERDAMICTIDQQRMEFHKMKHNYDEKLAALAERSASNATHGTAVVKQKTGKKNRKEKVSPRALLGGGGKRTIP